MRDVRLAQEMSASGRGVFLREKDRRPREHAVVCLFLEALTARALRQRGNRKHKFCSIDTSTLGRESEEEEEEHSEADKDIQREREKYGEMDPCLQARLSVVKEPWTAKERKASEASDSAPSPSHLVASLSHECCGLSVSSSCPFSFHPSAYSFRCLSLAKIFFFFVFVIVLVAGTQTPRGSSRTSSSPLPRLHRPGTCHGQRQIHTPHETAARMHRPSHPQRANKQKRHGHARQLGRQTVSQCGEEDKQNFDRNRHREKHA